MSIDPDDHHGREQGDDHQKYGLNIEAENKEQAIEKGKEKFLEEYGDLPIHWVKVFEA